jgi:hypothetical protein
MLALHTRLPSRRKRIARTLRITSLLICRRRRLLSLFGLYWPDLDIVRRRPPTEPSLIKLSSEFICLGSYGFGDYFTALKHV